MSDQSLENRRPLKSRSTAWARALAAGLARIGVSPDLVSFGSIVFAACGFALFVCSPTVEPSEERGIVLIAAAVCIQLRLLCNLLDGMVAVEHGRGTAAGPIWNELPDRIADALFLVGAGYFAAHKGVEAGEILGWIAAVLAMLTAYVRELGRGLGFPADFSGPMAKPHRMAALTVACIVSAMEPMWGWRGQTMLIALAVIVLGSAWTILRRTFTLARRLREQRAES